MEINKIGSKNIEGLGGFEKPNSQQQPLKGKGPSFADILGKEMDAKQGLENKQAPGIQFSNHALDRIRSRGIQMGPEQLAKLETAVSKAESKGAKETLVLMDSTAMIVNIKNKTVVTALDQSMMKENVFTNIDSTVIL